MLNCKTIRIRIKKKHSVVIKFKINFYLNRILYSTLNQVLIMFFKNLNTFTQKAQIYSTVFTGTKYGSYTEPDPHMRGAPLHYSSPKQYKTYVLIFFFGGGGGRWCTTELNFPMSIVCFSHIDVDPDPYFERTFTSRLSRFAKRMRILWKIFKNEEKKLNKEKFAKTCHNSNMN